ncbi:helix-turn-helix transcriptional regulator [Leptolyngbya sp. AN02str]|uniref:helix-turn-helix transcriptional regulator n=1 Tax=Leptolyngbya sp. AN02str TaxID=3423363 RepID=UPI003D31A7C6
MRDEPNKDSVFVQLRQQLGLTQKQVAGALGVSEQTVRNWEQGKTTPQLTIPQTKKLCELLGLPIDQIPDDFGPIKNSELSPRATTQS